MSANLIMFLLVNGEFDFNEKRRWLHPLFLDFYGLFPLSSLYLAPICLPAVGLSLIIVIDWCSFRLVERPRVVLPDDTLLASVWLRMLLR